MVQDAGREDAEQSTELDEDVAMSLVNSVITNAGEPEEPEEPEEPGEPEAQDYPGWTEAANPPPDYGEQSYVGHNRMLGRRALITGGDSGVGKAVAIAFAREGADVAFTYLPEEEQGAEDTVALIEDAGSRALAFPGDLQDEEFCQDVIAQTVAEFGGLNVLVNNAGFYVTTTRGIEDLDPEHFDRTFKTNVYALFWLTKAALQHLRAGAAIINTSSIQGYHPSPSLIAYAATQAAINNMTFSLAESLGPRGIRVNAVAPGDGQETPLGRAGQPAELAATYVLLASEDAGYISGSVIGVTGGKHLA
jgi:NAD(P)-dependent dehydrogenase (short-subunit alcohol dehydrogenase family)